MTELEYSETVTKYEHRLIGFIMSKTKDIDMSRDVTQDAFLKLWLNKSSVIPSKAKSWLFTTAYNHMINLLKVKSRLTGEDMIENKEDGTFNTIEHFDTKEIILEEIKNLNQRDRRLIVLRDVHKFTYAEIGDRMNLTETQVKVYLFRVRKKLKDKLKSLTH